MIDGIKVSLVVAVARNGVIGAAGGMPWRLSTDLKRFKTLTMGKPVIMGRKTWGAIPGELPGREKIVITRDRDYTDSMVRVAHDLKSGLDMACALAREAGSDEICVIGGGQIYSQAMEFADKLYVTHIEAEPDGDTIFPEIDDRRWKQVSTQHFEAGERDTAATCYAVYERRG